jgi:hypothetical protein
MPYCPKDPPDAWRRSAVFIVIAEKGARNRARKLFGHVVRKAFGIRRWHTDPYYVDYMSDAEARSYDMTDARYTMDLTDREMECLYKHLRAAFMADGWEGVPFDVYHD